MCLSKLYNNKVFVAKIYLTFKKLNHNAKYILR